MGWNIGHCGKDEYTLLNGSDTLFTFNGRSRGKVDLAVLLTSLEEANVPLSYADGINEVQFTLLPLLHGDYFDGKIRLSCSNDSLKILSRTFVHELAHHIDDVEDISGIDELMVEKKRRAKYIDDKYAGKNVGEYIAVGFEVFYFGSSEEREKLMQMNPKLYRTIMRVHKKYTRKDSRV